MALVSPERSHYNKQQRFGEHLLSQHLSDIHRLTEKAELAIKLLIIRNKILNT